MKATSDQQPYTTAYKSQCTIYIAQIPLNSTQLTDWLVKSYCAIKLHYNYTQIGGVAQW